MSRRILVLALAVLGACCFAAPALAKHSQAKHHRRTLVMTHHWYKKALHGKRTARSAVMPVNPVVITYSNYNCEVTVGTGADGNTPTNFRTNDSSQFYFPYTNKDNTTYWSVTSNCIGKLPNTATAPTQTTSHALTCTQFDPTNADKRITGYGIETTYPDGLYSETCNTPNFQPSNQL